MIYKNDPRPIRNIVAELLANWKGEDCTPTALLAADLFIQAFFEAGLKIEKHSLKDATLDITSKVHDRLPDFYKLKAAAMFKVAYADVTQEQRQVAKIWWYREAYRLPLRGTTNDSSDNTPSDSPTQNEDH